MRFALTFGGQLLFRLQLSVGVRVIDRMRSQALRTSGARSCLVSPKRLTTVCTRSNTPRVRFDSHLRGNRTHRGTHTGAERTAGKLRREYEVKRRNWFGALAETLNEAQ